MEKTDSIYVMEDLVSGKCTTTHIHNLRPFNYDPAYITHHGSRNRRSTLEFQVRWAGFGKTCDSWEPYKALIHVDNPTMKTLITKEYKQIRRIFLQIFPEFSPNKMLAFSLDF
jgi:hypothetical protein